MMQLSFSLHHFIGFFQWPLLWLKHEIFFPIPPVTLTDRYPLCFFPLSNSLGAMVTIEGLNGWDHSYLKSQLSEQDASRIIRPGPASDSVGTDNSSVMCGLYNEWHRTMHIGSDHNDLVYSAGLNQKWLISDSTLYMCFWRSKKKNLEYFILKYKASYFQQILVLWAMT